MIAFGKCPQMVSMRMLFSTAAPSFSVKLSLVYILGALVIIVHWFMIVFVYDINYFGINYNNYYVFEIQTIFLKL